MIINNYYDLIQIYVQIIKDEKIGILGPPFSYYYADTVNTNILAYDVNYIDVKSAFPTIATMMFGKEHPFVIQMNQQEGKFKKNKYIATTLTNQTKIDGKEYLRDFNIWSKILCLGYVFSKYENINILQYIKDGVVFTGDLKNSFTDNDLIFLNYIQQNDVIYHEDELSYYFRINKTTITNEEIKGKYKDLPVYIKDKIIPAFLSGDVYKYSLLKDIKLRYSDHFFNILFNANLIDDLKYYYSFTNQYLNINGDLNNVNSIYVKSYLTYIIYPILSLLRSSQKFTY